MRSVFETEIDTVKDLLAQSKKEKIALKEKLDAIEKDLQEEKNR